MMTIHKRLIEIEDLTKQFLLPFESTVLSIQEQDGKLCIWYISDIKNMGRDEAYIFMGVLTSECIDIPINMKYFSTVQMTNIVIHCFLSKNAFENCLTHYEFRAGR